MHALTPLLLLLSTTAACATGPALEDASCTGEKCDEGAGPNTSCGPTLDPNQIPEGTSVVTIKMDADGRPVSQHTAFPFGGGSALSEYVAFDSNGRLQKEVWTRFDAQGNITTTPDFGYTYEYANGKLSRLQVGSPAIEFTDYSYSPEGDLSITSTYAVDSPEAVSTTRYENTYDTLTDYLEVVETSEGGNRIDRYKFDMLSPAEQPASIRIGDSALHLESTVPVEQSLVAITTTESFQDSTVIFAYDTLTGDFLIGAEDESGPVFVVSYECAD